jgi:hypothetical protein
MYRVDILIIALGLIHAEHAFAGSVTFDAKLTGRAESPPAQVGASGELMAMLDTSTRVLTYEATYSGLTGVATTAGFCGTANGGKVGPQLIALSNLDSPISGHANLTETQADDLQKGRWCFNISTQGHPDGEIGGQIKRSVASTRTSNAPDSSQDPSDVNKNSSSSLGLQ